MRKIYLVFFRLLNKNKLLFVLLCYLLCVIPTQGIDSVDKRVNIVWAYDNGEHSEIRFKQFYGGIWHQDEIVTTSKKALNFSPAISLDSNKNLISVWSRERHGKTRLLYSVRNSNGEWSAHKTLSNQEGENLAPVMLLDLSNKVWVFWTSDRDKNDDIYTSIWGGRGWSVASKVNNKNAVPDISPKVSLDENGNVRVSWQVYDIDAIRYVEKNHTFNQKAVLPHRNLTEPQISTSEMDLSGISDMKGTVYIHFPDNYSNQSTSIVLN